MPPVPGLAILVGLTAEAKLADPLGCLVAAGGGSAAGASEAVARLVAGGATGLISFGLAGGLDPSLRPGTLIVPRAVVVEMNEATGAGRLLPLPLREGVGGRGPAGTDGAGWPPPPSPLPQGEGEIRIATDPDLAQRLGGMTPHTILGGTAIAGTAAEKRRLWQATGAAAVDLESGAVARAAAAHGLPFAVLRAICDPAHRNLPPAALTALNSRGAIGLMRVIFSLIAHPGQFGALMALAADAAAARRTLGERVGVIGQLARPEAASGTQTAEHDGAPR
ncbi:MAG: hypothetical protein P4L71_00615 [Acetobacteraceae bacterium]|nr:hypothetical protein [Acetobacteraceae bacterium]